MIAREHEVAEAGNQPITYNGGSDRNEVEAIMGERSGEGRSWYDLKRNNKRALRNRERKRKAREFGREVIGPPEKKDNQWPSSAWVVVEITSANCEVVRGGRRLTCTILEEFLVHRGSSLAIGDRVAIDEERSLVTARFPRRTRLVRMREDSTRRSPFSGEEHVLAANVDVAVVVAALANPPFHPRLIDRYLVMCQNGGIQPLVCINKCDLPEPRPDLRMYIDIGIPVVFVSATTGDGLDRLLEQLRGQWSVLVGHSGVGKSSLTNALLGNEVLRVRTVGGRSGRGRHTTTASSVHEITEGTYVIDTPGIRSWGLWAIDRSTLKDYFPEFTPLARHCRYRDCTHTVEPDCAVREAVEEWVVPRARYESYRRLFEE